MGDRLSYYKQRLGELAYERLQVARRLDKLDGQITAYEAALEVADQIKRDTNTQAAVNAAKEDSNA